MVSHKNIVLEKVSFFFHVMFHWGSSCLWSSNNFSNNLQNVKVLNLILQLYVRYSSFLAAVTKIYFSVFLSAYARKLKKGWKYGIFQPAFLGTFML